MPRRTPHAKAPAMPTQLSVNVNKVALLRNTRHLGIPSVTRAASLCLQAGAAGITVHPRPDGRHIRPHDVQELAQLLRQHWPGREYNIEGNPTQNLMEYIHSVRPHQATFVPDSEDQFTSDHGWDLRDPATCQRLRPLIAECQTLGVRVSLFMDADPAAMPLVRALGADRIELYTEPYAAAHTAAQTTGDRAALHTQLQRFAAAAQAATDVGLGVNAGHDLSRDNLRLFLQSVPGVAEVSIGHALIADALELGYPATVQAYLACIPVHAPDSDTQATSPGETADYLQSYENLMAELGQSEHDQAFFQQLLAIHQTAWQEYDHAVADSVALIFSECGNPAALQALAAATAAQTDADMRAVYHDWAEGIRLKHK